MNHRVDLVNDSRVKAVFEATEGASGPYCYIYVNCGSRQLTLSDIFREKGTYRVVIDLCHIQDFVSFDLVGCDFTADEVVVNFPEVEDIRRILKLFDEHREAYLTLRKMLGYTIDRE